MSELALPEGWIEATLGSVCSKPQYGWTTPARKSAGLGTRLLRTTDISGGRVDWDSVPFCSQEPHDPKKYLLHPGDILVSRAGSVGLSHVINGSCPEAAFASYLIRFRPLGEIPSAFIGAFLQSPEYWSVITEEAAGITMQNINASKLSRLRLPLPPLAEQRRIVAKVVALLEQVNKAKERLAKVPLILKRFRQAVLAAGCCGRLTETWRTHHEDRRVRDIVDERLHVGSTTKTRRGVPSTVEPPEDLASREFPETWALISVAECLRASLLLDVKDGNHGVNHPKVAEFTENGIPFITAAQVNNFAIDYDGAYKLSGKALKRIAVGFAKDGDAILTHKGSVGRSAVCDRECVLTPQTTYYRPDPAVVNARYLSYWFASPLFYAQLAGVMSQTTRDFVPISEQYRLFIVLPPIAEQEEIVRRIDAVFVLAASIEHRVKATTVKLTTLPQIILSKAFSGELVPTEAELARAEGREYESASALLARLAKSAAAGGGKKRETRHGRKNGAA